MKRLLIWISIISAGLFAVKLMVFPGEPFQYRMTISVTADGEEYSGSTVTRVRYETPKFHLGRREQGATVRAQALILDIGDRGTLVALLFGDPGRFDYPETLPLKAFGISRSLGSFKLRDIAQAASQSKLANLAPAQFPMLLLFKDIDDPRSLRIVDAATLDETLGTGADIKAWVEIQPESASLFDWMLISPAGDASSSPDIFAKIPWLKDPASTHVVFNRLIEEKWKPGSISVQRLFVRRK